MSDLAWLAAAFSVAWLAIAVFLVRLWRSQRAIDRRLEELARQSEPRQLG